MDKFSESHTLAVFLSKNMDKEFENLLQEASKYAQKRILSEYA